MKFIVVLLMVLCFNSAYADVNELIEINEKLLVKISEMSDECVLKSCFIDIYNNNKKLIYTVKRSDLTEEEKERIEKIIESAIKDQQEWIKK